MRVCAATRASEPVKLEGFSVAAVSYPEFFNTLGRLKSDA